MTAEEFVNEVQNSNQYYKEFEKEYKNFQIYQKKKRRHCDAQRNN